MSMNLFDDLVLKAKDLADAAGKKTNDIYEISKYKYECIKVNGEIRKLYEEMGNSVYSMVKGGYENHDLIDALVEEIDEKIARLKELDAIIADRKSQSICPVCGAKNLEANAYCAKCGSRLGGTFYHDEPPMEEASAPEFSGDDEAAAE